MIYDLLGHTLGNSYIKYRCFFPCDFWGSTCRCFFLFTCMILRYVPICHIYSKLSSFYQLAIADNSKNIDNAVFEAYRSHFNLGFKEAMILFVVRFLHEIKIIEDCLLFIWVSFLIFYWLLIYLRLSKSILYLLITACSNLISCCSVFKSLPFSFRDVYLSTWISLYFSLVYL